MFTKKALQAIWHNATKELKRLRRTTEGANDQQMMTMEYQIAIDDEKMWNHVRDTAAKIYASMDDKTFTMIEKSTVDDPKINQNARKR